MTKLVIAEKPMLARDIARAMCNVEISDSEPLPIRGNGYTVCALSGHVLQLVDPQDIDARWGGRWREEVLPINPKPWPKTPTKPTLLDKIDLLIGQSDEIIHAGDPDQEGQLIVDEVLDYLGYQGKVTRVYITDSIPAHIQKAFEEAIPNEKARPDGNAALARQLADFAFGANESRLASLRTHTKIPVGRVKTPTLALIVARDKAIQDHVKREYFELYATLSINETCASFKFYPIADVYQGNDRIYDRTALDRICVTDMQPGRQYAISTTKKEALRYAPLPYDFTNLCADMNKRYGMSGDTVTKITQVLRDKYRAITYNRSSSAYLTDAHWQEAHTVLDQAMDNINTHWHLDYTLKHACFDDAKVKVHHGIIPQQVVVDASKLSEAEFLVYQAIVERYAMQFTLPCVVNVYTSRFTTPLGGWQHITNDIVSGGWKDIFNIEDDDDDKDKDDQPTNQVIFPEGQSVAVVEKTDIKTKQTKPLKPYTEATLIKDMASIAKFVEDPSMREALKKKDEGNPGEHGGIGTVATRPKIIADLISSGLVARENKKLRSTKLGQDIISILPKELTQADTTACWWLIQQSIVESGGDPYSLMDSVINDFCRRKETAYKDVRIEAMEPIIVGKCPICGQNVVDKGAKTKAYSCESNKYSKDENDQWVHESGCGFSIFKMVAGKKISIGQVKTILDKGQSNLIKGFTSKSGKTFDAILELNPERGVSFKFPQK